MMVFPIILTITEVAALISAGWHYLSDDIPRAIYWMTFVVAINVGWRQR